MSQSVTRWKLNLWVKLRENALSVKSRELSSGPARRGGADEGGNVEENQDVAVPGKFRRAQPHEEEQSLCPSLRALSFLRWI